VVPVVQPSFVQLVKNFLFFCGPFGVVVLDVGLVFPPRRQSDVVRRTPLFFMLRNS
jgi:hypothetical protein